ncbi:MAG: hypothetical protein II773_12010, partial [Oscillospiraceae bacterium]|nr:hypothetical protein [Oscillospiraceae bacterium]
HNSIILQLYYLHKGLFVFFLNHCENSFRNAADSTAAGIYIFGISAGYVFDFKGFLAPVPGDQGRTTMQKLEQSLGHPGINGAQSLLQSLLQPIASEAHSFAILHVIDVRIVSFFNSIISIKGFSYFSFVIAKTPFGVDMFWGYIIRSGNRADNQ